MPLCLYEEQAKRSFYFRIYTVAEEIILMDCIFWIKCSLFCIKVLDLQTLLANNKAVIMYGACATGKSTCYQTLSRALSQFHSPWSSPNENKESFSNENFTRVNLKVVYPNTLSHEEVTVFV